MSRSIWKYEIPIADSFALDLPLGAEILHVGVQAGSPYLWALVYPNEDLVKYQFALRGTGHDATGLRQEDHIGTFFLHGGALIFHLFLTKAGSQEDLV